MNSKNTIYLFCQYFPFYGGEQFLFNEVEYYPNDCNIIVFTEHKNTGDRISLSSNFHVINEEFTNTSSVREIVLRYWKLIIEVFIYEIYNSPHRLKYIKHFKTHLFLLIGYLQKAEVVINHLPKKENEMVLYSYWFDEWVTILHLVKRISKYKIKVVCRTHAYDFDEAQVKSGYHIFRCFDLNGIDKVFSISNYGKNYIQSKYNKGNVSVEKLGVKDIGMNPILLETGFQIVSCSALVPLKRVHLIIDILKNININLTWTHFGGGPLESSLLIKAKELPTNINFIYKGVVKNEEILNFYKTTTVDIFLSTSELEGIPVSMMEAISFGIPLAGCNICGVPEIINNTTGILFESDFLIAETAINIKNYILNKSRNVDLRKEIKSFWKNNHNGDSIYPEFINRNLLSN